MKERRKNRLTYAAIEAELDDLMRQYGFDPNNGTAQLKNSGLQRILAYGRVEMLRQILDWRA